MYNKQSVRIKKVILSVTNDLITEQRINKVALSLIKMGYSPLLVGRKLKNSPNIESKIYPTRRFWLPFDKGWIFYACYNFRLFIFLLFRKADILIANDLDTLLANYLAFKLKKIFGNKHIKLVYDSHEIFTEVPELNNRGFVKSIWLSIEKWILPKIKNAYTVCLPIADFYRKKYGINMLVIKNMPVSKNSESYKEKFEFTIPEDKKIILYQGVLNIGRGIEQIIDILDHLNNVIFIIIGTGDIEEKLKKTVYQKQLNEKVIFTGKLALENLPQITKKAEIGLVLQEDISLSYHYVLPNRLFDFIQAGVPVLASALPEIKNIVENEKIGITVKDLNPDELIKKINLLLYNQELVNEIKNNINNCKLRYCWENEEPKLFELFNNLL